MPDFKLPFGQRRRAGGGGPASALDEMAAEIRTVDEAAQRASRRIAQSARRLRSSSRWHRGTNNDVMGELADALAARADAIRAECDALRGLVERARGTVAKQPADAEPRGEAGPGEAEEAPPAPPAEADWRQATVAATAEPWPQAAANGGRAVPPRIQDVRLVATQMAIAGSTRAEIEAHLRGELGFAEVEPMLNQIFGDAQRSGS